jgi:glycyl-tRNA synthetase
MLEKSDRIEQLTPTIASMLGLEADDILFARRAAHLAKADLATRMVVEMTSLQGIMGREYALRSGEAPQVAQAIGEQYQAVPASLPGLAVAIADRLDSLAGLFAADLAPSGTKDPFGLRRAALGVVQPLIEHDLSFDLQQAVQAAAALQPIPVSDTAIQQVLDFLAGRLRVVLMDKGFRYDVVDAVLAAQSNNPAGAAQAVGELTAWVERPDWNTILPAYARCVRILRSQPADASTFQVNESLFEDPPEKELYHVFQSSVVQPPASVNELLGIVEKLIPAINAFFDKVLVMTEDPAVRQNRLALVNSLASLSNGIADLSKLEGF